MYIENAVGKYGGVLWHALTLEVAVDDHDDISLDDSIRTHLLSQRKPRSFTAAFCCFSGVKLGRNSILRGWYARLQSGLDTPFSRQLRSKGSNGQRTSVHLLNVVLLDNTERD